MATVQELYRYPGKGLSGQALQQVDLAPGDGFPLDRAFALAHGNAPFDPADPQFLPKTNFLMLLRNERLAALQTHYDEPSGLLTVRRDGRDVAKGNLREPIGRKLIEQFFAAYMKDEVRGSPRLVQAPGHRFADCGRKVVSLIGLASIRDLERVARMPLQPLRFRANLYFDGFAPWTEFDWVGSDLQAGEVLLRVVKRISRCAATDVNPETAVRDGRVPVTLQSNFGHVNVGVYAEVISAGTIAIGDTLRPL